ncbi:D-alanyl-D-alanine carboxypeptidase [Ekhidna sp. To15]|uniref:D-alanyl-D-alanine carboxypeptidase n=1 Tax=Ekhidna sp. To15 TaxID=3395267 RepID=UPI003F5233BA
MIQYYFFHCIRHKSFSKSILLILVLIIGSCASVKQLAVETDTERLLKQSEVFSNQFTGFSLFDVETNKYIAGFNSTLKFTPASNTKLLTMYAALKTFTDSLPSIVYQEMDSGVLVYPIGDPTFLYKPFETQKTFDFLNQQDAISVVWPEEDPIPFGSGWAWDDYIYNFQPQRSWWPIYGNTVSIKKVNDSLSITPPFFEEYVEVLEQTKPGELVDRELNYNVFKAYLESDTSDFERIIPFEYSKELLFHLLKDTMQSEINWSIVSFTDPDTLFSQPIDTVLARMMKPSDNFLSEQLLLMAARKHGYKEIKPFINAVKDTWLISLNDLVWVDGSGLSRYNLIAPVDQVRLLKMCLDEFGWERLTSILPTGGQGTLEERYLPNEYQPPFIFAKTGTLSNNHNLSGYLITRSGKRMIFSLMSNHYTRPTDEVKDAMEQFLIEVRNAY